MERLRKISIGALAAIVLFSMHAHAVSVVATQAQIKSFLGNQGGILMFTDNADGSKLKYIDIDDASLTIQTLDTAACANPHMSSDGTRVAYERSGNIYTRYIFSGSPVVFVNGMVEAYWFKDGSDDWLMFCQPTAKYGYTDGNTYKYKVGGDGVSPTGAPVQIYSKAYDGGITPDRVWIGEAYGDRHAYNLVTSTEYTSFYKTGGGTEGQCCNASMAPMTGPYRFLTLVLPHQYFRTWQYNSGSDRWEEYKTYTNPAGTVEWQRPEWSLHPNYITVVALDGGYDLYIHKVDNNTSCLKVLDGDINNSHLYVGLASGNHAPTVNLTASPTSGQAPLNVSFNSNSSDPDSDPLTHEWDWTNDGTYDSNSGATRTASHTYSSIGTYTCKVRVSDGTDSVTDTVTINVTAAPYLNSVEVTPDPGGCEPGGTAVFTAVPKDQFGSPYAAVITWSISGGGSMSPASSGSAVTSHNSTFQSSGAEGTFQVTATAAGSVNDIVDCVVVVPPVTHIKINCGSNTYDVVDWERDDGYVTGGSDWTNPNTVDTSGVANAAPAEVYRSVRHTGPHSYAISVDSGTYTLRLHFADHYTGPRDTKYTAEDVVILDHFDYASEAGGTDKALVKDFSITVNDGVLNILCEDYGGTDVFEGGIEIIGGGTPVNNPPTVNLTVDQASGTVPLMVNFNANSNDPDNDPLTHEWDWDGDGSYDQNSGSDATVSHTFSSAGSYTVRVRVSDGTDSVSDTIVINVSSPANNPPTVDLQADATSGTEPLTVDFDAQSNDADSDPLTHEWDWNGDGTYDENSGSDDTVSHVFSTGTHTVRVRVSDGTDSVTDTVVINVSGGGGTTTITLDAQQDTFLTEATPAANNDQHSYGLNVNNNGTEIAETLIQFDTSGISASETVVSATLRLYCYRENGVSSSSDTVEFIPCTSAWDETTATWNSDHTNGSVVAKTEIFPDMTATNDIDPPEAWNVNVTAIVQDWVMNPANNNGLRLRANDSTMDVRFVDMEASSSRPSECVPVLEVTYGAAGPDSTPPTVIPTHAVLSGTVNDDSGPITTVVVQGVNVTATAGNWTSGSVSLTGSSTNISVTATDPSSNTRTLTVNVTH
ncbi:MAG: DNRLRE domain-containing protein [Planctomycetes bacterium]|nr:DNRLRE domain-containing protein [Planctomycetota bacterium]